MFYAIWPFIYNMKMQAFENRFQSERFWKCTIVVCVNYKKCEFVIFFFIVKIILLMLKKTAVVYMILPWTHSTNILGFTDWTLKK